MLIGLKQILVCTVYDFKFKIKLEITVDAASSQVDMTLCAEPRVEESFQILQVDISKLLFCFVFFSWSEVRTFE